MENTSVQPIDDSEVQKNGEEEGNKKVVNPYIELIDADLEAVSENHFDDNDEEINGKEEINL